MAASCAPVENRGPCAESLPVSRPFLMAHSFHSCSSFLHCLFLYCGGTCDDGVGHCLSVLVVFKWEGKASAVWECVPQSMHWKLLPMRQWLRSVGSAVINRLISLQERILPCLHILSPYKEQCSSPLWDMAFKRISGKWQLHPYQLPNGPAPWSCASHLPELWEPKLSSL